VFCIRSFVFHAPTLPFAKGVIGPVPPVFFKERDAVLKILLRARRPRDGGKLADIDSGVVLQLKLADGLQNAPQIILVYAQTTESSVKKS